MKAVVKAGIQKKRLRLLTQPLQKINPAYFMAVANTAVDAVATVGICFIFAFASSVSTVSSGWFRA